MVVSDHRHYLKETLKKALKSGSYDVCNRPGADLHANRSRTTFTVGITLPSLGVIVDYVATRIDGEVTATPKELA